MNYPPRIAHLFATILISFTILTATALAQPIATYQFHPGWATFGLPLPPGAAPQQVNVGSLPTQTDVKLRWPDGSIKFAVVTAKIPAFGNYELTSGAAADSSPFVPNWPAVRVRFAIEESALYEASLPEFSGADAWLSGPLVRESRVVVAPRAASEHSFLRVIFDIRSYNDGTHRVEVVGANTLNVSEANALAYDLEILINNQRVYERRAETGANPLTSTDTQNCRSEQHGLSSGDVVQLLGGPQSGEKRIVTAAYDQARFVVMTPFSGTQSAPVSWRRVGVQHWWMTRWRRKFGVGGFVEAATVPDFTPFYASKAMPRFLSTVVNDARYLTYAGIDPFQVMGSGFFSLPMGGAGGRAEIGPYPQWVARYLVHRTTALHDMVIKQGDAAATFGTHITEPDGQTIISIDRHPQFMLRNDAEERPANRMAGYGWYETNNSHMPSMTFFPYLLTGDRFYADEMKFYANFGMLTTYTSSLWPPPASRGGAFGYVGVQWEGARGFGWALRNLADTAAWLSSGDAAKSYFEEKTRNNLVHADQYAATKVNPLGVVFDSLDGHRPPVPANAPAYSAIALWEQAYLAWALDRAQQLGFTGGTVVRNRIAKFQLELFTNPGCDPEYAAPYTIPVAVLPNSYFGTFRELCAKTRELGDTGSYREAGGPSDFGAGYGPEARLLLQIAEREQLPGATQALEFLNKQVDSDGGTFRANINGRSQFAIDSGPVPPSPPPPVGPHPPKNLRLAP